MVYKNFHNIVNFFSSKVEYFAEVFAVQVLPCVVMFELFEEFSELVVVECIHLPEDSPGIEEIGLKTVRAIARFIIGFWLPFRTYCLCSFGALFNFFSYRIQFACDLTCHLFLRF